MNSAPSSAPTGPSSGRSSRTPASPWAIDRPAMPSLRVRRATENDLPAIVALIADDGLGKSREDLRTPLNAGYRAAFAALTADPNQLMAVLVDDGAGGEPVGCLQLTFIPGLSRQGA